MIRTRNELPPRIGVTLAAETMLSVAGGAAAGAGDGVSAACPGLIYDVGR